MNGKFQPAKLAPGMDFFSNRGMKLAHSGVGSHEPKISGCVFYCLGKLPVLCSRKNKEKKKLCRASQTFPFDTRLREWFTGF